MKQLNITEFNKLYPTEKACLDEIFDRVYGDLTVCPDCETETKWSHVAGRKCYACQWCGYQVFPLAKTPLKDTKISISKWFFAILLFGNSKNGVAAKELERQLGVSYKTAFRIGHVIREMMNEDGEIVLSGDVEIDESLFGGKKAAKRSGKRGWGADRPCVFGMVERGGNIVTKVVKNRKSTTLMPIIVTHTTEEAVAHTDDFRGYAKLGNEVAAHHVVAHSEGQHVAGPNGHHHTQTIDGFWSIMKRSIRGTHTSVSRKYLQRYLNEFSFRRNHRTERMFEAILGKVV
jgi:transposase